MKYDTFQGRKIEGFTRIPNVLVKIDGGLRGLSICERMLLVLLMEAYPTQRISIDDMARALEATRNTISKHIKSLEAKGYIKISATPTASSYDYTPFLDMVSAEHTVSIPSIVPPEVSAAPAPVQTPPPQILDDPDPNAMTQEQEAQADAMMKRLAAQSWDVDLPPPPQRPVDPDLVRWQELGSNELQRRLSDARNRPASLYYPSLGDSDCESQLHAVMAAVYAEGFRGSHDEAWGVIDIQYQAFVMAMAADAGYDRVAEFQRMQEIYARYFNVVGDTAIEFRAFLDRYYRCHEFREYEAEAA